MVVGLGDFAVNRGNIVRETTCPAWGAVGAWRGRDAPWPACPSLVPCALLPVGGARWEATARLLAVQRQVAAALCWPLAADLCPGRLIFSLRARQQQG